MSGQRPFFLRLAAAPWRFVTNSDYRTKTWLRLERPKGLFQPNNDTSEDRYPEIFCFVQQQLGADNEATIFSFGCSTGEEVFALRRYFARAMIKGIDINRLNIAQARKRLRRAGNAGISFQTAASTVREPSAYYDAIFCMAVLRHGALSEPGTTRCDHRIRFEDFAATVADFHRCLKAGGLLAIRHSNFRLSDAPISAQFETVYSRDLASAKGVPLFGPDNRLLPGARYPDTVFRKKRP